MSYKKQNATLLLKKARLSFTQSLFEPKQVSNKNPAKTYSACFIIEAGKTQVLLQEGETKTPVNPVEFVNTMLVKAFEKVTPKHKNWVLRANSDCVSKAGDRYAGFEDDDGFHMNPKKAEKDGPPIFMNRGRAISVDEARNLFYGGCYVNAKITVITYNGDESVGATAYLVGVNFVEDGDPFSARNDGSGMEDDDATEMDEDAI